MICGLAAKCLAEIFSSRVNMGGGLKDRGKGRTFPFLRAYAGMNDPGVEMLVFFYSHGMYPLYRQILVTRNSYGRQESALGRQSGHWSMARQVTQS
jgi:hypothetical protein